MASGVNRIYETCVLMESYAHEESTHTYINVISQLHVCIYIGCLVSRTMTS